MTDREQLERQAADFFAMSWNRSDSSILSTMLADEVEYISRKSGKTIKGKSQLIEYLQRNMSRIKKAGDAYRVFAEIGITEDQHPCVLLAQKYKENIHTLVLFTIEWSKITKIYLCKDDPHPTTATRTGEYPGFEDYDDDFEHYYDNDPDEKISPIINLKPKTPPKTKKKNKGLNKILVAIVVLIGLAGGIFILQMFLQ